MGYWSEAYKLARSSLWKPLRPIPSIAALAYVAIREGRRALERWQEASVALLVVYVVVAIVEFLWRLLIIAPPKIYTPLKEQLEPKLEILFELKYPYIDQRIPEATESGEPSKLFRVGVRVVGGRTVEGIRVKLWEIDPRPRTLFPPLLLQAMHDRPGRITTALNPGHEPWYFDVVEQHANGAIYIVETVPGTGGEIPPKEYRVRITASGRDVPTASKWFFIWVPAPRQGNQDLQFTPAD